MTNWDAERQALIQMRDEVLNHLESTGNYGLDDSMGDELGELSNYDNHPADIGSELFERGKDLALRDRDKIQLQEIERALQAMDNGTYGICESCGQDIPRERLEVHPATTMCVDCKAHDENMHPDRTRPIEEEFLYPGFARTDTDDTSNVAFDGEDAWQAVERFDERSDYLHNYQIIPTDDNEGIVEKMDQISNEDYRRQLPDSPHSPI